GAQRLLAGKCQEPVGQLPPALRTTKVDVVQSVESIASMLDRLTGPDIRLELDVSMGTWPIEADPARLEEALLNLTVNARDAIQEAGKIILSCRNRSRVNRNGFSQDFVEIELRDTGVGMTDAVLEQARDPFFTTKPVGKGTGLGLSMVEGFVKQSGGEMHIQSRPGAGTDICLLMPRTRHDAQMVQHSSVHVGAGDGESVLVIEDDDDLATLLFKQLEGLNYRVTLASDGHSARQAAQERGGFDVVLSDVMLADGERAPHVVEDLLRRHPNTRAIFMTGFASDELASLNTEAMSSFVLRKPFNLEQLVHSLRHVLTVTPAV
ncbi:MAG: ATP-binding protein, partial [Pseudomonadota bacterium]